MARSRLSGLVTGRSSVVQSESSANQVLEKSWGESAYAHMVGASGSGAWSYGWGNNWGRQELANHYTGFNYLAIQPLMKEIGGMAPHAAIQHDGIGVRQARQKAIWSGDQETYRAMQLRFMTPYERTKAIAPVSTHVELEPVPSEHEFVRLLRNPNGPDTSTTFFRKLVMYWRLYGEFYIWLVPPKLQRMTGKPCPPVEMWVMPSHWMWPRHDPEFKALIKDYEVRPSAGFPVDGGNNLGFGHWGGSNGGRGVIPADQIVYYGEPNPSGYDNGYSPLTAISHWIDCSDSIDRSRTSQFQNGAFPGVVLEFDRLVADPDKATIERLQARIASAYVGVRRTGTPIVLSPGVKMRPLDNKPYEMAYTESADQIKDWVFAAQGTGQSIVGLVEQTTFNNVWGARANFYSNTIKPACSLLSEIFTEKIARRFDPNLVAYWPDTTPVDPDVRLKEIDTMLRNNVLTVNEVCAMQGYQPKSWGDKPLDMLKAEFTPAAQAAPPGAPGATPDANAKPLVPPVNDLTEKLLPDGTDKPKDERLAGSPIHTNGHANRLAGKLRTTDLAKPSKNGKARTNLLTHRLH